MERYIKIAGGKMRVILCLLVWMLVGAACDSFLDIAPSKKTNIELSKVEHLDALLAAINTTTGNTSLVLSPDITGNFNGICTIKPITELVLSTWYRLLSVDESGGGRFIGFRNLE